MVASFYMDFFQKLLDAFLCSPPMTMFLQEKQGKYRLAKDLWR